MWCLVRPSEISSIFSWLQSRLQKRISRIYSASQLNRKKSQRAKSSSSVFNMIKVSFMYLLQSTNSRKGWLMYVRKICALFPALENGEKWLRSYGICLGPTSIWWYFLITWRGVKVVHSQREWAELRTFGVRNYLKI